VRDASKSCIAFQTSFGHDLCQFDADGHTMSSDELQRRSLTLRHFSRSRYQLALRRNQLVIRLD